MGSTLYFCSCGVFLVSSTNEFKSGTVDEIYDGKAIIRNHYLFPLSFKRYSGKVVE